MSYSITELDSNFIGHLAKLAEVATAANNAVCSLTQRAWYLPPLSGWSGDLSDLYGMNQAFDRTNLNNDYISIMADLTSAGTTGEAMVLKLQLDYIAALERAFRTRSASSVRVKIHAAARRNGHGATGGLYDTTNYNDITDCDLSTDSGNLVNWLNNLLNAAHSDPERTC